jgi:hypothetical protein
VTRLLLAENRPNQAYQQHNAGGGKKGTPRGTFFSYIIPRLANCDVLGGHFFHVEGQRYA